MEDPEMPGTAARLSREDREAVCPRPPRQRQTAPWPAILPQGDALCVAGTPETPPPGLAARRPGRAGGAWPGRRATGAASAGSAPGSPGTAWGRPILPWQSPGIPVLPRACRPTAAAHAWRPLPRRGRRGRGNPPPFPVARGAGSRRVPASRNGRTGRGTSVMFPAGGTPGQASAAISRRGRAGPPPGAGSFASRRGTAAARRPVTGKAPGRGSRGLSSVGRIPLPAGGRGRPAYPAANSRP
jgi:hypothetical protein